MLASARSFVAENAPVAQRRKLRDSGDLSGFSRELWCRFADMGFSGVLAHELMGGLALGLVEGLTKVFYPEASNTVIFIIMAIVLMVRPQGLFGTPR